ncbi:MAG: hypothetical protein ACJ788_00675, partial [Ktedonobacteraceae bacterium]
MDTEGSPTDDRVLPNRTVEAINWTAVALYIILAFALSWTTWLVLRAIGVPFVTRTAIGMFGPAVAAILVRLIRHEGFADAGLRLTGRGRQAPWRMYIAAYLVPPALIAASIGFVLLTGVQHWAYSENLHASARAITAALAKRGQPLPAGLTADQLAQLNVIVSIVLAFTLGILINMFFTFGEEFGWRGYLLPRLAPLGGIKADIIIVVMWVVLVYS